MRHNFHSKERSPGNAPTELHSTLMERYRQIYYEGFDLLTETINNRCGYRAYRCLENPLVTALTIQTIVDIYGEDTKEANLEVQLETFASTINEKVSNVFAGGETITCAIK